MRRPFLRLIGLLVAGTAFLYLFTYRVGWDELVARLWDFDHRYALPVILGQTAFHLLGGLALWVLSLGFRWTPLGSILLAYWRCLAVGYWTPATVGEASFAWLAGSAGVSIREGLALVTVDKIVTLGATCMVALPALWIGLPPLPYHIRLPSVTWLLGALVIITAFVAYLRWHDSPNGARILEMFKGYLHLLEQLGRRSAVYLIVNALITLVRTVTAASVLWWAFAGFGMPLDLNFMRFLVLVTAARLLALVVPSPNGFGVFEVALVELIGTETGAAAEILSGALVARLVALLVVTIGLLSPPVWGSLRTEGSGR